jgi:elongation factor 2
MSKWINAGDTLLEMMVNHLPSPKIAQKYRFRYLYEGPPDDLASTAIRDCDPDGPLMMFVSKQIPTSDKGRFFSYGRVFSGSVSAGMKVRLLGPNFIPGTKNDVYEATITRAVLMMGKNTEFINECPAGNLIAVSGIDKHLTKTGTVTTLHEAHNIRNMKYSVSPVVRVAVRPKEAKDLPKLIEGMKRLAKSDPLVQCITEETTGQNIICGSGELHIEICIKDLGDYSGIEIIKADPIVSYKETVSSVGKESLCKSSNKLNRLWANAEPLAEEIAVDIENGLIDMKMDPKERNKKLKDYGWDKSEVVKIWSFGPDTEGPNILMDSTKQCQYMHEIKDSMVTGFQLATESGVLCQEGLRGVRFNITDTTVHSDSSHRGGAQIIPTSKRVYYASQLKAEPRLQEPVFLVEISCPYEVTGAVYGCLNQRRGEIIEENVISGTPITIIKAYMPVIESIGFTSYLRSQTAGKAFPTMCFSHWKEIDSDPLSGAENSSSKIVKEIRLRKGLDVQIPVVAKYEDKL